MRLRPWSVWLTRGGLERIGKALPSRTETPQRLRPKRWGRNALGRGGPNIAKTSVKAMGTRAPRGTWTKHCKRFGGCGGDAKPSGGAIQTSQRLRSKRRGNRAFGQSGPLRRQGVGQPTMRGPRLSTWRLNLLDWLEKSAVGTRLLPQSGPFSVSDATASYCTCAARCSGPIPVWQQHLAESLLNSLQILVELWPKSRVTHCFGAVE